MHEKKTQQGLGLSDACCVAMWLFQGRVFRRKGSCSSLLCHVGSEVEWRVAEDMSMRENSEVLRKSVDDMARALAHFHGIFVQESVAVLGESEGKKLVERVVARFGEERGRRIREEVLRHVRELTHETLAEHYDLPLHFAWKAIKRENGSDITYCPMCEEWKEKGMVEEGELYCAIDFAIARGFSENLTFSRSATLMQGDSCCCHRYGETPSSAGCGS